MTETVEIPVWIVVLALLLAGFGALDRVLVPSLRWFLRRRMERVVVRLNQRLQRPIEPFKLMRRQDRIVRLVFDPKVMQAVADQAAETGVPQNVVFEQARRYAREIVPGFSATLYFGFATWAARALSRVLYRVRIGRMDAALDAIDPKATVIFVINHRSNMDYVLVTWLVARRGALSYAVGEWARVWPLSAMIRAMGAYFIRRGRSNPLYRKVLERHVQMATADGITQALFPEGGLSLDGRIGPAKLGLLHYIIDGFDPAGRDVIFVPVGLSYDRVPEDLLLVQAGKDGTRRFRPRLLRVAWEALVIGLKRASGHLYLFGSAGVGFGPPVSLRAHLAAGRDLESLAADLMEEVGRAVPVLPVPLCAAAILEHTTEEALAERLLAQGAVMKLPPGGAAQARAEGRAVLTARGVLGADGTPLPGKHDLLAFYAAQVRQRLEAPPDGNAATRRT
ncbi:1-acyl-sn-glycerol-3-phosphate acyltransferase [Szabonella alba]|uniref:Glycerol-3-phosphate acyltransferase n=1 Tax=Szabonella alba TaxID=2804194 RepID=A0A8K0XYX9_9RHOB|nr:1-acyl-sn-glycerol-3-phosphate acyltransferase [Szabonella alba]MBL4916216.1 1-acyl-sn-glycerol-3-phosphate acyltransferase [Szabonella alba]